MKNKTLFRALRRSAGLVLKLAPAALFVKGAVSLLTGVLSGFLAPANEYLFCDLTVVQNKDTEM